MIPTKAVKAIIRDDEGKILILQRNPKTRDSDVWDLPGGLVDDGESEEEALVRELREELGVEAAIEKKSRQWSFLRLKDGKKVIVQNYICRIDGAPTLSDEHQDYVWIAPASIRKFRVKDESLYEAIEKI